MREARWKRIHYVLDPTDETFEYTDRIFFAGKEKKFGKALQLYKEMREKDIPPTVFTYFTVINIYGLIGDLEKMTKAFFEMRVYNIYIYIYISLSLSLSIDIDY